MKVKVSVYSGFFSKKVKVSVYSGFFSKKPKEEYVVSTGKRGMIIKTIKGVGENGKHSK